MLTTRAVIGILTANVEVRKRWDEAWRQARNHYRTLQQSQRRPWWRLRKPDRLPDDLPSFLGVLLGHGLATQLDERSFREPARPTVQKLEAALVECSELEERALEATTTGEWLEPCLAFLKDYERLQASTPSTATALTDRIAEHIIVRIIDATQQRYGYRPDEAARASAQDDSIKGIQTLFYVDLLELLREECTIEQIPINPLDPLDSLDPSIYTDNKPPIPTNNPQYANHVARVYKWGFRHVGTGEVVRKAEIAHFVYQADRPSPS